MIAPDDRMEPSFAVSVETLHLDPLDLDPASIVEGAPQAFIRILHTSTDGRVVRGVWELTAGTVTDVEEDECFVVIRGRATVEVEGGTTLELAPGTVGVFTRGARTTWHVRETLRKVFQTTTP